MSVTPELRGPTESERRAVQQAVEAGDLKRANALLSGIRRRLAKSNRNKRASVQLSTGTQKAKRRQPRGSSKPSRTVNEVRIVGSSRLALCPVCRREFSVNRDGRVRAHRDGAGQGKCRGGGVKVAKAWKTTNQGNSIRTVSGGLPGLGKRK
jgi:fructose-1,6-bisphosphatase/inositol monophosphatase family enzyme